LYAIRPSLLSFLRWGIAARPGRLYAWPGFRSVLPARVPSVLGGTFWLGRRPSRRRVRISTDARIFLFCGVAFHSLAVSLRPLCGGPTRQFEPSMRRWVCHLMSGKQVLSWRRVSVTYLRPGGCDVWHGVDSVSSSQCAHAFRLRGVSPSRLLRSTAPCEPSAIPVWLSTVLGSPACFARTGQSSGTFLGRF